MPSSVSNDDLNSIAGQVVKTAIHVETRVGPLVKMEPNFDFGPVVARFREAYEPDPGASANMAELSGYAHDDRGLAAGEVGAVTDLTQLIGSGGHRWHGESAKNFNKYYLAPFARCQSNQIDVIRDLQGAIGTWNEAVVARRQDYHATAVATIDALDSILECSWGKVKVALTIAGTAISIAGVAPTGGASLSGLAVLSAANSALNTAVAENQFISGQSPHTVIDDMFRVLNEIDKATSAIAFDLAGKVQESLATVSRVISDDKESVPSLVPREPNHPDGPTPVTGGDGKDPGLDFKPPVK